MGIGLALEGLTPEFGVGVKLLYQKEERKLWKKGASTASLICLGRVRGVGVLIRLYYLTFGLSNLRAIEPSDY